MAALCLDASLETLRPLLSPHTPSPGGSLPLPSQGIPQTVHAVVTLLAQVPEETVVQISHPYNPSASLSSALDNMQVVTELMANYVIGPHVL